MNSVFNRFPDRLQAAITCRLGWTSLRPVQELAGDKIIDGYNALILAPTAGGKTEACMFPLLAQMVETEPTGVGILYIAPIKALLNNQADRFQNYTQMIGLNRFLWHGDIKRSHKNTFIRNLTTVLMTTPESLEGMLISSSVPHETIFADLRAIVIDEIHALAGSDRGSHLMSVLERLLRVTNYDVQRIGLSATVGNPIRILQWLQGTSQRPSCIIDPPPIPSKKEIRILLKDSQTAIVEQASLMARSKKSLFFCQSRALSEGIAAGMKSQGIDVFVHHSSVALEERTLAEARFQHGHNNCIVCTSTLELGIDVGDLDAIFQHQVPRTVSSFLQRMGRTGRREGEISNTTFFVDNSASLLQAIALVELARKRWVEPVRITDRNWAVLVQQILAMTMQFGAVSPEDCWQQLSIVPDFQGINRSEFDRLIRQMLTTNYLYMTGGLLSIGTQTEKVFGRKNFLALYAVFSTPANYEVQTIAGQHIGSLDRQFVDTLTPEITCFLLGGRAWIAKFIHHPERKVEVTAAPQGGKPKWGEFMLDILSWEICQEIASILSSTGDISYLDANAHIALTNCRIDLGRHTGNKIYWESDLAIWWTFAGQRINQALKYGLEYLYDWKIKVDNFNLSIAGDTLNSSALATAIEQILEPEFWQAQEIQNYLLDRIPNYHLSKFQQVLPDCYALEIVQNYLLDIDGISKLSGVSSIYDTKA
jgi:ATP-dependent helicase Lhr and Lhr-like helicase